MTAACWLSEQFARLHAAYRAGDRAGLVAALGHPPDFPNCRQPFELAVGDWPLEYAISWSPLAFIDELLALGADPNYPDQIGFPSLIAALAARREDRHELMRRLIAAGARLDQRGLNDWTPLHHAVALKDAAAVDLLLAAGADPALRTRIDECSTPLEDAEALDLADIAARLRAGRPA